MDANSHPIKVKEVTDAKFYANKHPYKVKVVGGGGGGTSDYEELSNLPQVNGIELKGNKTAYDLDLQKSIKRLVITQSMVISQNPVKVQFTAEMDTVMTDLDAPYIILDASAIGLGSTAFAKSEARTPHYWQLTQIAANFQTDTQTITEATEQTVLYNDETRIGTYEETVLLRKDDVKDNLNSTSENTPLSAKQGKVLKDYIDEKLGDIENILHTINNGEEES